MEAFKIWGFLKCKADHALQALSQPKTGDGSWVSVQGGENQFNLEMIKLLQKACKKCKMR